jgi:hypothetical protein
VLESGEAERAACDDANGCTQTALPAGVCHGANPVVCLPLDACHRAGAATPARV